MKSRPKDHPHPTGWLTLSQPNIIKAKEKGLPVVKLVDGGESLDLRHPLKFIERRNRIAHGDYSDFSVNWPRQYGSNVNVAVRFIALRPRDALDQFLKCSDFLKAWVEQKPPIADFFMTEI